MLDKDRKKRLGSKGDAAEIKLKRIIHLLSDNSLDLYGNELLKNAIQFIREKIKSIKNKLLNL